MIRDRKMYVAPTPFGLTTGTAHHQTLILPSDISLDKNFKQAGKLVRREAEKIIIGYTFDLKSNILTPEVTPNPMAGREHTFLAWRLKDSSDEPVALREKPVEIKVETEEESEDE